MKGHLWNDPLNIGFLYALGLMVAVASFILNIHQIYATAFGFFLVMRLIVGVFGYESLMVRHPKRRALLLTCFFGVIIEGAASIAIFFSAPTLDLQGLFVAGVIIFLIGNDGLQSGTNRCRT